MDAEDPSPITELLRAWRSGDARAGNVLFQELYDELRRTARGQRRGREATLSTTALVHEAYLRLAGAAELHVSDRSHLLAIAATAMRQIVVDSARRRAAARRGGDQVRVSLGEGDAALDQPLAEVLAVEEALARLETVDPRLGKVVEMRFFAGMSVDEVAATLEVSPRTVKRDWRAARAFLHRQLAPPIPPP